MLSNPRR